MSERTITFKLQADGTGNAVVVNVFVQPPIPFSERMATRLERVAKRMADAATAEGGIVIKAFDPRESSVVQPEGLSA
jgi:hypothetical protein